jgi:LuxR family maltose regulon positive regulatory protein
MASLLLATKLYIPPSRPDLIRRERLLAYLDEGIAFGRKVMLVSAPAGFGKTTLVSEWVHYRADHFPPCRCAWVTLDKGDNRLPHFIAYLVAAFQKIYADLGQDLLPALQLPQSPPVAVVLTELLNQLAARSSGDPHEHYLLVLDDYQEITEPAGHEAVTFLLEQLPPQWHLVLTSRSDPALPLARLRARGQLTEIRAADLRFTDSEIATYLQHTTGLAYSPADIAALTVRTEGWIAGLQLLGLLLQDNLRRQVAASPTQIISNFTGANRYVIDYLTDEVLDQQPAARLDFLLRTSILERLTAPLCDALLVADQPSQPSQPSQVILAELEKQNLFLTPLDEQRQWYRYHRLFADLLQTRLHQEAGAAEVAALHLCASAWFEQHGLIAEALHHALAAADHDRAVELVAAQAMPMIRRGAITTVQEWLNALPPTRVRAHPRLCIHQAWVLFYSHQPDELEFWINAAEAAGQTPAFSQIPNRTALVEQIAALRISVAELRQENLTVVRLAQAALARLAEDELGVRGTNLYFLGRALCNLGETKRGIAAYRMTVTLFQQIGVTLAAMGALSDLAIFLLQQGKLREARLTLEDALRWAATQDLLQVPATAQLQMVLGQIYYEQNELTAAAEQVQRSMYLAKYMLPLTATLAHLGHAQVQWAQGNRDITAVALQEAAQVVAQRMIVPPESTLLVTRRVRLWLLQEDWPAVEAWIVQSGLQVGDEVVYGNEQALIALARIWVTRGRVTNRAADLEQATALLTRLAGTLRIAERAGHLLEVLILQAVALSAQARWQAALSPLTAALHLAAPEGYRRLWLDEGPVMQRLLSKWQQQAASAPNLPENHQHALTAYVNSLQHDFATQTPAGVIAQSPADATVLSPAVPVTIVPPPQPPFTTDRARPGSNKVAEPLSQREIEVLHLMATGLDNSEIADALTIAVSTVKTHVNRIFAKLTVRSRTQAVARAREQRLIG